jgi:DNA invertase Pin-like site-specific DNA recombinase
MAPSGTPIRCAIYTRQSVEPHDDLSSCQVQFEACLGWITSLRSLGFEVIPEHFDDEGYSGTTLDRPALKRLLAVVRSGGIEQLVVYRLDRLSRNLRHFTTLFEELGEHNVALEIVTAPGLGNAAIDKLMLNVLGSFAEFERDLAASRIAEARAHLKAHGRRIAGATPFGYSADRHTKQLVVCDVPMGGLRHNAVGDRVLRECIALDHWKWETVDRASGALDSRESRLCRADSAGFRISQGLSP